MTVEREQGEIELEDILLENIVQADFSRCIVSEQAVSVLTFNYLEYLFERNKLKCLKKTFEFGLDFIRYTTTRYLGNENLEYAYAPFSECPINLIDVTAEVLTPNQTFFDIIDRYRKNDKNLTLDIITRDSIMLVESYIKNHKHVFDYHNISIGRIYANHLYKNGKILTGKANMKITLLNKPELINSDYYYICDSDEYNLYQNIISKIISI